MSSGLAEQQDYCPYCGERILLLLDGSVEDSNYVEDCSVCCQPILVHASFNPDGELQSLQLRREDGAG
jgi:Cysteine-rich CPXCG